MRIWCFLCFEFNSFELSIGGSCRSNSLGSEPLDPLCGGLPGSLMRGFEVGKSSGPSAKEDSQIKRAKIDSILRGCLYGSATSSAADHSQHIDESCNTNFHSICKNKFPSLPS